jgi:hypothetical protein
MKIASVLDLLSRQGGPLFPVVAWLHSKGSLETMSGMREL